MSNIQRSLKNQMVKASINKRTHCVRQAPLCPWWTLPVVDTGSIFQRSPSKAARSSHELLCADDGATVWGKNFVVFLVGLCFLRGFCSWKTFNKVGRPTGLSSHAPPSAVSPGAPSRQGRCLASAPLAPAPLSCQRRCSVQGAVCRGAELDRRWPVKFSSLSLSPRGREDFFSRSSGFYPFPRSGTTSRV